MGGSDPAPRPSGSADRRTLLAIVGPTAVGKTALALELAERLSAQVLSLDSMLVYRGLDIGTAKPTPEERGRVPHHLIDLVSPVERYDVQRYLADAASAEQEAAASGHQALYVGGTGFYLQALLAGLDDGLDVDLDLRAELERTYDEDAGAELMRALRETDPASAERIHVNDRKRLVRAHEILRLTGKPPSELRSAWQPSTLARDHRLVGLAVEGSQLRERIVARTRAMLDGGWIEEVRAIEASDGFGPTSSQALGYPEVRAHLAGELGREELVERIVTRTWRFSRRQLTWYRRMPSIEWVDPASPNAIERALGALDRG